MAVFEKHFSVSEAQSLVNDLKRRFSRIQALLAKVRAEQEAHGTRLKILRGNGKGPIVSAAGPLVEEIQGEIGSVAALGIQIKDLDRGLIDFPHFLNGDPDREVFLCFEMREDNVCFWHEIEAGYGARRPL